MDLHDFDKIEKCGNIVFAENNFQLVKLWQLDNANVWVDDDTGLFIVNFQEAEGKWSKYYTIATPEGRYLTTEVFEIYDEFYNGMAIIYHDEKGYGYINSAGKVIYSPAYEKAENFSHGHAFAVKNGQKYLLDKDGNAFIFSDKYKLSGYMCDGMLPVSTLLMPQVDLSLWSDGDFLAGQWGYIDGKGKEIIAPQYIYANYFVDGLAVVCKGQWYIKSDNSYWCDEQLWGVIDVDGNEVIPCQYEGMQVFCDTSEFYRVYSNGKWGVMDRHNKWIIQPQFESLGCEYHNGLVEFYDTFEITEDCLCGIYDAKTQKVLLEPQNANFEFLEGDLIIINFYGKDHKPAYIINRSGEKIFSSDCDLIYLQGKKYLTGKRCDGKILWGLLDSNGSVILPCKYQFGICIEDEVIYFSSDDRKGIMDFKENILCPAEYQELDHFAKNLFIFEKDGFKGIISVFGQIVLPGKYKSICLCRDNRIIASTRNHTDVFEIIYDK